jgi:DNA gyrase subunit B
MMVKNTAVYDAASIQVLEYPENIQRRPGMYVGGKGESALHHLAIEVIDNSVDEALAGVCDYIDVTIEKDGSITIVDTGRGFPVGIHPEKDKSALEVAFTELHAGGKFEEGSYSTSGGLHGVGIKATNALSTWLEVEVKRDGVIYHQRYELGLPATEVQILDPESRQIIGKVGQRGEASLVRNHAKRRIGTGSRVQFMPNPDYLDVVEFSFTTLARRLQIVAFLVPGLRVHILDKRDEDKEREYQYNGGIKEYVNYLNQERKTIHTPIEISGATEDDSRVEVVFQYQDQEDEEIISFVNTIPTPDGGKHVAGFRSALTKATNVFAAEKKLLKSGDEITGRDTISGITAVINVSMRDPQFTSQTNTQLGSDQIQGQVHSIVYDALLSLFRKNIPLGKQIVSRCLAASHARHAATKARALVMRRSVLEVDELPGKLADVAKGVPIQQTTLYIVEGDSAGGSCKQARNRNFHAILPLRGKILNTERIRLGTALANTEVKAIVAAIGAGVGSDFDVTKMRYGRIAILVDADVDGDHIKTLLYTLFWRFMRPMVEEGKLFIARAPLYLLRNGKQSTYAYTDTERDRILNSWGKKSAVTMQRYKGLGEMNPSQLRETVFKSGNPDPAINEHLIKVTVNDIHAANTTVGLWMGGAPEQRRIRLMQFWEGEVLDDNGHKKTKRTPSRTRKSPGATKQTSVKVPSVEKSTLQAKTPSSSKTGRERTASSQSKRSTKTNSRRTRRTS